MKIYRTAALTGIILASGVYGTVAQTVVIKPQQETVIHKYVVEHQVAPTELPQGVTVEVGTALPDTVELHTIQSPDLQTQYDYVMINGQTVIVDPQTREIVKVLH